VLTPDGRRTYFSDAAGVLWLYERATNTTARLVGGPVWDLSVSATANAIAYTKVGERRGDRSIWAASLDAQSGLVRGDERRLSDVQGDAPSLSPDGTLVAFAEDDANGVGQSVVIAPVGGGREKVVAPNLPSNVANIRWTPDGSSLFIGVNPPVSCEPQWSCLPLATPELRQPAGSIRRVKTAGGPLAIVTTAKTPSPGLSPDGTTLLFLDTGTPAVWTVAGADGKPRASLPLPAGQTPVAWLTGSIVVFTFNQRGTPLRILTKDLSAPREE
jgi:dipeptidyl aminopeptidase/acylaminoacyl peptidase